MAKKCERLISHCTYGNLLHDILNEGIIPRKVKTFDIDIELVEAEALAEELSKESGKKITAE